MALLMPRTVARNSIWIIAGRGDRGRTGLMGGFKIRWLGPPARSRNASSRGRTADQRADALAPTRGDRSHG